jgi:flagellar M-ring protein FliF
MDRSPAAWLTVAAALLAAAVLAALPLAPAPAKATTAAPFAVPAAPGTEQARLQSLLDSTVGAGRAVVLVNATVNRNATSSAQLSYARTGTPVASASDRWSGGAGTRRVVDTERAVGAKVTTTRVASGATTRQNVALVVDRALPRASVGALRRAVGTAAGINRARGDRLTVARIPFVKKPAAPPSPPTAAIAALSPGGKAALVRYAGMAVCGLIFLIALIRALVKAEDKRLD